MPGSSLRVLQAITSPGVGGRELFPASLTRQLLRRGQQVWLACTPETTLHRLARDWDLPTVPLRLRGYFDLPAILRLARWLRREHIQLIHAHWSRDLSNLIVAARLAGNPPLLLTKHVYATERKRDFFHDWIYRNVARVFAVSRLVADNLLATTTLTPEKILTLYPGLDLQNEWQPARLGAVNLRTEFGVPAGARLLGFAGRWNAGKGLQVVVEAFGRLATRFPEWHLAVVGRAVGPQEEEFAAAVQRGVRDAGLAERVHFVPYRTDMPAVLRTCDVVVCASVFESLGLVVAEAMAMERPVIGPDSGGVPEMIVPGVNGELFRTGDAADLADKLAGLLADSELRRRWGLAGRRLVEEKFDLETMTTRTLNTYADVLGAGRS
jgi:glycosyltransferase involved in cell wall biosynthesis